MQKIDNSYWGTLTPPLAPSESDVQIFIDNIAENESVSLLGVTKELAPIAHRAYDNDPYTILNIFTIPINWLDIEEWTDNFIGDGVLNIISMEDCNTLVARLAERSKKLIVRVFNEKTPDMRVAFNFPTPTDFEIQPTTVIDCEGYKFFIWDFNTGA